MTKTIDTAAAESLRSFALSKCVGGCHPHDYADNDVYVRFARMVTAALDGEAWAGKRVADALDRIERMDRVLNRERAPDGDYERVKLTAIRTTDTTRPDGAIARNV